MPTNTDPDRLKALKVIDLKNILTQASVHAPAKANKADLITRILASKPALDVFNSLYPTPQDDLVCNSFSFLFEASLTYKFIVGASRGVRLFYSLSITYCVLFRFSH